ncbi:14178_t:CDS:2, partial [Cetraspora pellucida]
IDDNSAQEIYNDLLSLYCSEIEEGSKNTLEQRITEIVNSDDDFEIGECSKNTVPEIIEIIDSDDDLSKNQCYTLQEKKKWRAQSEEIKPNLTRPSFEKHKTVRQSAILNIKRNWELIRNRMEETYKVKRNRTFESGDFIKIRIPDIDKNKMSRRSLPCKVLQKKPNIDSYQVACQYGILEHWYPASELELLGTPDYPSLNV